MEMYRDCKYLHALRCADVDFVAVDIHCHSITLLLS